MFSKTLVVATPLLEECDNDTHTLKMGTWESSGTFKTLEFNCRGQNTSHWGVIHIIGKLSKCRCRKCPCMSHLDIYNTSYGKKKGRGSNWQFDSQPLKIGNRPDLGAFRWGVRCHWKAFNKSYKSSWDHILIEGLSKELCPSKVVGVRIGTISGLFFGSLEIKSHLDVGATKSRREYYMGEGGGFPWVWAMVSLVSPGSPVAKWIN
jgi:hypothetical protein